MIYAIKRWMCQRWGHNFAWSTGRTDQCVRCGVTRDTPPHIRRPPLLDAYMDEIDRR